jgi:GT2 family glycosyltransferase
MKVHFVIPYALDKNLGKAYNETMAALPDGDWACLLDYDVQLLTPDAGRIIHEYATRARPDQLLTCYTNRVSTLSKPQLLNGVVNEDSDIRHHIGLAERQRQCLYQMTQIARDISGMLMLINKKLWAEFPFTEDNKCLGVDTEFNRRTRAAGKTIMRMDGLYVWHAYRLKNGIHDKTHLL